MHIKQAPDFKRIDLNTGLPDVYHLTFTRELVKELQIIILVQMERFVKPSAASPEAFSLNAHLKCAKAVQQAGWYPIKQPLRRSISKLRRTIGSCFQSFP